jgi:type IV pilus biogenesis protein CpaD/CtpE
MSNHAGKACTRLPVLQQAIAVALATALAACASTSPPNEQIATARAAVSQAQPVAVREGGPELGIAQAKLERAEEAMQRGDYVSARILAEQAEVDARYAWTLAENARMQSQRAK